MRARLRTACLLNVSKQICGPPGTRSAGMGYPRDTCDTWGGYVAPCRPVAPIVTFQPVIVRWVRTGLNWHGPARMHLEGLGIVCFQISMWPVPHLHVLRGQSPCRPCVLAAMAKRTWRNAFLPWLAISHGGGQEAMPPHQLAAPAGHARATVDLGAGSAVGHRCGIARLRACWSYGSRCSPHRPWRLGGVCVCVWGGRGASQLA